MKDFKDKKQDNNKDNNKRKESSSEKYRNKPFKKKYQVKNENEDENSEKKYSKAKFKKTPYKKKDIKEKEVEKKDEPIRLNKYIAKSGICSRREADTLIEKGKVHVNGKVVTEMGVKVMLKDKVVVNGKDITPEKKIYILINKPKDYISTVDDPYAKKTVLDLVRNACEERVYPVGRLDRNTTGVLLLTNDGDLTKKLTHPKYNKKKIYHVTLDKAVTKLHLNEIVEGLELEDGFIQADAINYVDGQKNEIGIELHSGKNRIVRRIFEYLDYKVVKLDRVYFAGLTKKGIQRGKHRFLTEKDISMLKRGAFE